MRVSIPTTPGAASNVGSTEPKSSPARLRRTKTAGQGAEGRNVWGVLACVTRKGGSMVTVNVVVLAGTVSVGPIEKEMPSGDKMIELRLSVPEAGKRLLPLPVVVWDRALAR